MARKSVPRNILVTRFSALGDVAMTIPVVYDACAENPASRFIMLTRPLAAGMFLDPPPNLTVVGVDLSAYKGAAGMRRLFSETKERYDIDAVVDLHDVLRTKLIRFFARLRGIPTSHVDKGRAARKALTRHTSKTLLPLKPMPERYRDAFVELGIDVASSFRSLFPSGKGNPGLFAPIEPKRPGEIWLAVAPFAAHDGKIYPLDLMMRIVDHYAAMPDYRIFIFGAGEKESAAIDTLAAGRPNVVSMARLRLGMAGELSLMSHCDTMLAMDSANMHMASLVGLRTVSIWGATHPYTGFYGFRQDPADAVQLDMVCRPCSVFGNRPCARHDYHCLRGITPQHVISRIGRKAMRTLGILLLVMAGCLSSQASTLTRADRLSPLAAGYLERARIMLSEGNYAGVVDQLKHLDTQHTDLPASERQEYAYLLALSLYERGDADCVELLRQFADMYPSSPQALPARMAAADYFFFARRYAEALVAYSEIDRSRINPSQQPLYDYRRALCMLRTGHLQEARPIFTALGSNPEYSLAAEYYLAYCDYVDGDLQRAYEGFSHVAEAEGSDREAGIVPEYYLAQIDYVTGHYQKAADLSRSLLESDTDPELLPEMERVAGISLFKLGDATAAEKYLRLYLRHDDITPSNDAIYALGVIEYDKGDLDSASGRFSRLTDLESDLSQSAYLYLGQIAVRENDPNAAAISFEKASRMNFDPEVTETALYNYITARTRGGNIPFSSSIPMMREFLRRFPRSHKASEVEQFLATAYFNERDYAHALESVKRISSPDNETLGMKQKILYQLGVEAMSNNRPEAARTYLRESVAVGGDLPLRAQANLWLGDADYALGRYNEAEKAYEAYLKGDRRGENRTIARYNLAYALLMQDKYTQSAQAFAEALKGTPRLPLRMHEDALIRMADAQYYAGDYRQALKNYTSAIENGAADADYATFRRAVMYGLGGDINMKLSELSAMSTRFPGSKWIPNALLEKGQTYTSLGETSKAVTAFEQLRNSYRQSAEARRGMLSLALAYMKGHDEDRATATYREIIEKWPSSEEARLANEDLRSHYARTGGLNEYAAFLRGISGAPQLDPSEMEKLAFEGAETAFASDAADLTLLERYVTDYPDGANIAQALLDIASGRHDKGDSTGALIAIDKLLAVRGDSPQMPEALLLRAEILEAGGATRRREARDAWRDLEQRGGTEYAADAYAGIMRTTDNDQERLRYATLVRNSGGLPAELLEEAEFYEAVAGLSGGKKEAEATLRRLAANPSGLTGAKAAVTLGQHYLDVGNVSEAERVLTSFTDAGSPHSYWLARGFIDLADVCEKRGKTYLAVEYLKSLRDNYPGDELDIHDMISTRLKKWK